MREVLFKYCHIPQWEKDWEHVDILGSIAKIGNKLKLNSWQPVKRTVAQSCLFAKEFIILTLHLGSIHTYWGDRGFTAL